MNVKVSSAMALPIEAIECSLNTTARTRHAITSNSRPASIRPLTQPRGRVQADVGGPGGEQGGDAHQQPPRLVTCLSRRPGSTGANRVMLLPLPEPVPRCCPDDQMKSSPNRG